MRTRGLGEAEPEDELGKSVHGGAVSNPALAT